MNVYYRCHKCSTLNYIQEIDRWWNTKPNPEYQVYIDGCELLFEGDKSNKLLSDRSKIVVEDKKSKEFI